MALLDHLDYNADSGTFTWSQRRGRAKAGDIAGHKWKCRDGLTYIQIRTEGKLQYAHRLAWLAYYGEYPNGDIDHINGDGTDNRICNLRLVSNQENSKNSKLYVTNKTGIPGVYAHGDSKWRSVITVNAKTSHLGIFDNLFEAVCARKSAELKHSFHQNHGRNL